MWTDADDGLIKMGPGLQTAGRCAIKGLVIALVGLPRAADGLTFTPSDADATLEAREPVDSLVSNPSLATGDFNGDGRDDIAVYRYVDNQTVVDVLEGGRWSGFSDIESKRFFRAVIPNPGAGVFSDFMGLGFADVNGDGRKDLFILTNYTPARVWVFFGRSTGGAIVDLGTQPADLEILVPNPAVSFAGGDVDGDGKAEALLGIPQTYGQRGMGYLLRGRGTYPGVLTAGDPAWGATFIGDANNPGYLGRGAGMGDVDGDGRDDVFLSANFADAVGNGEGMTYGFFGSSSTAWTTWDLTTTSAPIALPPTSWCYSCGVAAMGDFDGNGRDDLILYLSHFQGMVWVSDQSLAPGTLPVGKSPPFQDLSYLSGPVAVGDFDGDGRPDFFADRRTSPPDGVGWLSSEGGTDLTELNTTFPDGATYWATGDLDGDGKSDVVRSGVFSSGSNPLTRLTVVYGFRPFWAPDFTIRDRPADSPRIVLDMAPGGEPAEMRISGDVADDWVGRWMAYQPTLEAALTPPQTDKSISVTFREAGGRESATITRTLPLRATPGLIRVVRNRVRPGAEGIWEVSSPGGDFEAAIYTGSGERVRELESGDRPVGVWTVRWDGQNNAGQPVAPGIYILSVRAGGETQRHRILVQP